MNTPKQHPLFEESEMEKHFEKIESESGINTPYQQQPKTSLGSVKKQQLEEPSEISGANDPGWKILNLEYLPSKGRFYPINSELTIRAASVAEVRHWSTIDEHDKLSINEKLNFILEKCTRFKVKGQATWLGWNRILDVDRFFIVFRIYELTFPNQENKLFTLFECKDANHSYSERNQVKSSMLNMFEFPKELLGFYSEEFRCIRIESEKLGKPFHLYLPNLGVYNRIRLYRSDLRKGNSDLEPEFLKILPYLTNNPNLTQSDIKNLKVDYMSWSDTKFFAVTKIVDILDKAKNEILQMSCPKCSKKIVSPIFLGSSFSVKDLFFISVRLEELI